MRTGRILMLMLAFALLAPLGSPGASSGGAIPPQILDQSQVDGSSQTSPSFSGDLLAQTFTPSTTGTLDYVDLQLFWSGSPGRLIVQIRTTAAGTPTDTVLAATTITTAAFPTGAFQWVAIPVTTHVAAGTQYAIVAVAPDLSRSCGPCSDLWTWTLSGDTNAGGQAVEKLGAGSWFTPVGLPPQSSSFDRTFKTFLTPASAAPPAAWRLLASGTSGGSIYATPAPHGAQPYPVFHGTGSVAPGSDQPWWQGGPWRVSIVSNAREAASLANHLTGTPATQLRRAVAGTRFQYRRLLVLDVTGCCAPVLARLAASRGTAIVTLDPSVAACEIAVESPCQISHAVGDSYQILSLPRQDFPIPKTVQLVAGQHPVVMSTN